MEESYLQSVIRRFRHHKAGVVSFWIVAVIIVLALLAPVLAPYGPQEITSEFSAAPSLKHLLGTDQIGRDVLSRLLYGTRVSLFVGFMATVISTMLGVLLGLLAGYVGGALDMILMRFTDMVMSFPYILLILVASVIFKPGLWSIILIFGFVDWPGVARLVRGSILSIKEQDYVKSSQIAGMPRSYILFSDILPNVMTNILVFATTVMATSILDEAALSFLGMGIQPPAASLGNMLNGAESVTVLTGMPWLWISPGLVIIILVVCVNFVGDALRDALDPTAVV
ncbi:ABC transporter permease [Bilifractor porci]|jgi:peptide/nickel transport system permease protein|uniref:ABC transporter permease n=1 Tax=Bilifractor porci TaxID=2606636 RepID=A0A7X2TNA3_9FIRM|nr:ABC transporter permease [Bilifractor porci]MST81280.1 ABC transporter permease [Bilifractor porci]